MLKTISDIQNIVKDFKGYFNIKSPDGKYIFVNENWLKILNLKKEDVIGKADAEIYNAEIKSQIGEADAAAWKSDAPIEYLFDAPLGDSIVHTFGIKWAIRWEDGKQAILCTAFDKIENKQIVTELAKKIGESIDSLRGVRFNIHSLQRQRALFDHLIQGVLIVNNEGKINLINSACESMFGYEKGALLNEYFQVLIPDRFKDKHEQHHKKYNEHPEARPMGTGLDLWAIRKDGKEFPVEISLSPFEDEEGHFVIVFITDITIRKKHEEDLKNAENELEKHINELTQVNEEIRDFAFVSSHHLQEPLRQLQTYGSLLRKSLEKKMTPKEKENLSKMLHAAQAARQRIKDFLLFTRINIEERVYIPVNLNNVIQNTIEEMSDMVERQQAKIEVLNEMPVINGDPDLIKQLFDNLISNALKFHKIGVPPQIKISTRSIPDPTKPDKELVEISVEDNGVGFDEKHADKLFHLFQKISMHAAGTGIGLAISRKICKLHGGNLEAKSKNEEGAIFTATLPYKQ